MNYFLGIRQSDGVLAADFEDTATGLNHPVAGVTPIPANGAWHHAAATYDGTTWRLYLDGVARRAARRRRASRRARQHSARRDRDGVQLDGRHHERPDAGVLRRRDRRSAHLEPRAHAAADQPRADPRNHERARVCWDAGASTKAPARSSPTAPVTRINGTITGTNWAWVAGAPFSTQGNTAPVAADDTATTAMQTPVVDRRAGQRHRCRRRRAGGDAASELPAHGTAVVNPNGTITYTPAAGLWRPRRLHVCDQRRPGRHGEPRGRRERRGRSEPGAGRRRRTRSGAHVPDRDRDPVGHGHRRWRARPRPDDAVDEGQRPRHGDLRRRGSARRRRRPSPCSASTCCG